MNFRRQTDSCLLGCTIMSLHASIAQEIGVQKATAAEIQGQSTESTHEDDDAAAGTGDWLQQTLTFERYQWSLAPPPNNTHKNTTFSSVSAATAGAAAGAAVVTYDTTSFRRLTNLLRPRDIVVEIGCSYGKSTSLISSIVGTDRILGLDTSKEVIAQASRVYPAISFALCDVVATPFIAHELIGKFVQDLIAADASTAAVAPAPAPAPAQVVVFMDVGGNRELETNLAILSWIISSMPCGGKTPHPPRHPRLIVCKSQSLYTTVIGHKNLPFPHDCHIDAKFVWKKLIEQSKANVESRKNIKRPRTEQKPAACDGCAAEIEGPKANAGALTSADGAGGRRKLKHPMKAPRRRTSSGQDICRFHNYSTCKNFEDLEERGTTCPLDHDHCHVCGLLGHRAVTCPEYITLM